MNKRGVVLGDRARDIITNVDQYFENEKSLLFPVLQKLKTAHFLSGEDEYINVPKEVFYNLLQYMNNIPKVTERVCLATGINKNTVTRIRYERREAKLRPISIGKAKKKVKNDQEVKITKDVIIINAIDNIKEQTEDSNLLYEIEIDGLASSDNV